jgi:adhesin HecA-like repeat protein
MIYPNYIAKVDLRGSVIVSGDSLVLTSQSLH